MQWLIGIIQRLIPRSRAGRGIAFLAGGAGGAQLIALAVAPILTRLYTPADYGVVAVFTSYLGVASIVVTGKYELAIAQEGDRGSAQQLTWASILLSGCSAILISAIGLLCSTWIQTVLYAPRVRWFWPIFGLSLFACGTYNGLSYLALSDKAYGAVARTQVTQKTGGACVSLLLGFLGTGAVGLLLGTAFSLSAGSLRLAARASKTEPSLGQSFLIVSIWREALKHWRYPAYVATAALVNLMPWAWLPIVLSGRHGEASAGAYSLTMSIVSVPLGVLGQGVGQVVLSEGAGIARSGVGSLGALYARILKPLAILTGGIVACAFVAPYLFPVVFGSGWTLAGELAIPVGIMCAARQLIAPLSYVVYIYKLQFVQMLIDVAKGVLAIGVTLAMLLHGSNTLCTVWAFSLVMTLSFAAASIFYVRVIKRNAAISLANSGGEVIPPSTDQIVSSEARTMSGGRASQC